MESEVQLATRVENTWVTNLDFASKISIRNEDDIAPTEHEASKEPVMQSTLATKNPIRKR